MALIIGIQVLISLVVAHTRLSTSQFVFELEVNLQSVTTNGNCDLDETNLDDIFCETYFSLFCLREGRGDSQSTNEEDCPLGRNTTRVITYLGNQPSAQRIITSQKPWPVRNTAIL